MTFFQSRTESEPKKGEKKKVEKVNCCSKYTLHTTLLCTYHRTCQRLYRNSGDKPKDL